MDRQPQPRLTRRFTSAVYRPPAAPARPEPPAAPRPPLFRPQVAAALITTPTPPAPPPTVGNITPAPNTTAETDTNFSPPEPTATGAASSVAVDPPPLSNPGDVPNPSAPPPPLPEIDEPPAKTVTFSSRSPPPSPRKEAAVDSDKINPGLDPPLKQALAPSSDPETESGGRGRFPAEENDLGVVKEEITESGGSKGIISEGKAQGHEGMSGDSSESSGKREARKMRTTTKVKDNHHHHHRSSDADNNSSGTSSIITLAGENKGAIMELSPMRPKHGFIGIPLRLQQERADGDEKGGKLLKTGEKSNNNDDNRKQSPAGRTAFVNNNVQGINNSFLHGTSIHHRDPGVHLSISSKHGGNRYVKNP
ncbi:unnamed protein product [Cuscuta europaea]|uniref:Uncharacterized protein n=1 Tax=Cuscuta europaea TaxID=41803 RepID=A0A9P1EDP0_CUSEU|nr:unnamed protein product [Cuscuta europaea]